MSSNTVMVKQYDNTLPVNSDDTVLGSRVMILLSHSNTVTARPRDDTLPVKKKKKKCDDTLPYNAPSLNV